MATGEHVISWCIEIARPVYTVETVLVGRPFDKKNLSLETGGLS